MLVVAPGCQAGELPTLAAGTGGTMSEHELKRMPRARQAPPQMVPQSVPGESDLVRVDTTWGQLQPMQVA